MEPPCLASSLVGGIHLVVGRWNLLPWAGPLNLKVQLIPLSLRRCCIGTQYSVHEGTPPTSGSLASRYGPNRCQPCPCQPAMLPENNSSFLPFGVFYLAHLGSTDASDQSIALTWYFATGTCLAFPGSTTCAILLEDGGDIPPLPIYTRVYSDALRWSCERPAAHAQHAVHIRSHPPPTHSFIT